MAEFVVTASGLELRADYEEVGAIRSQYVPEMVGLAMLFERELCNGWTLCDASELGALSEAPVLSQDISLDSAGQHTAPDNATFYYFARYQVDSVLELLARDGVVVFQELR